MKKKLLTGIITVSISAAALSACGNTQAIVKESSSAANNIMETSVSTTDVSTAAFPGNQWVSLEQSPQFSINNKVYTLGKTTLQEMLDDGVPFLDNSVSNKSEMVKAGSESSAIFSVDLGIYKAADVSFINTSDTPQKITDCKLYSITFTVVPDKQQKVMQFSFPLSMTEDELKQNAGKPTDFEIGASGDDAEHLLKYKKKTEKHAAEIGYAFTFENQKLSTFTIRWYEN